MRENIYRSDDATGAALVFTPTASIGKGSFRSGFLVTSNATGYAFSADALGGNITNTFSFSDSTFENTASGGILENVLKTDDKYFFSNVEGVPK